MDIILKSKNQKILITTNQKGIDLTINKKYTTFEHKAIDLNSALYYLENIADYSSEFTCTLLTSHGVLAELEKNSLINTIDKIRFVTGTYTEDSLDRLMEVA